MAINAILILATLYSFANVNHQLSIREYDAVNSTRVDIATYETAYALPGWIVSRMPRDLGLDYAHIVEIDLTFSDLSVYCPDEIRALSACSAVHTLRLHNSTLTLKMRDALLAFPNLKEIYAREYFPADASHECDLRQDRLPGVTVYLE